MADRDDTRSFNQIKAYPRGSAQGGRAIQAVKGNLVENEGAAGHRTVIRETSEGRAIGRTRDGMPMVEIEKFESGLYMETGHLQFLWPGDGQQPHSGDPAKWRFMDIDPAGDWLGEVDSADGAQVDSQPTPVDTGILRDNIDSLAIGYERSSDPVKDLERREAALGAVVAKKMVASMFPASLWTGKMRLFMQAQYGALLESFRLQITIVGTTAQIKYVTGDDELQFGMWPHKTPGIFTAPDGTYYLLDIVASSATVYSVFAYPILVDDEAAEELVSTLDGTLAADERTKVEAYLFAHSTIKLSERQLVGEYNCGFAGEAIAYGWKFNQDGSKASVVLHTPSGAHGNYHLKSRTVHLTFSYNKPVGQSSGSQWLGVSGAVESHGDWIDGWGAYNIFGPEHYTGGRLICWSYAMMWRTGGIRPNFNFTNIPVYGYYKGDVWKTVNLSRTYQNHYPPLYEQSHSGFVFNPGTDMDQTAVWQVGFRVCNQPASAETHSTTEMTNMAISFDGYSYSGIRKYGTHTYIEQTPEQTAYYPNYMTFIPSMASSGPGYVYAMDAPGFPAFTAAQASGGFAEWPMFTSYVGYHEGTLTTTIRVINGSTSRAWAMVVPMFDAEALYIVRAEYELRDSETLTTNIHAATVGFTAVSQSGVSYPVFPYANAILPFTVGDGTFEDLSPPPQPWTSGVVCFNQVESGTTGVSSAGVTSLFQVSYEYPYYDPGMYTKTSHNNRYWMTEGLRSPSSVPDSPRFVGWA